VWLERGQQLDISAFVPFAEDSNLIVALDRYVLREARLWARLSGEHSAEPQVVTVNLSPRFVHHDRRRRRHHVDDQRIGTLARRCGLEITERIALANIEDTKHSLEKLRSHGILAAIDDFRPDRPLSPGCSSLAGANSTSRRPGRLRVAKSTLALLSTGLPGQVFPLGGQLVATDSRSAWQP
jgi:predicted signal transduction protein with EAL and GGDEF domain